MKSLLRDTSDPYMALLSYRTTPLPNYNPSGLLMGRRVKTDIPQTADYLNPRWHFSSLIFNRKIRNIKKSRKRTMTYNAMQDQLTYYGRLTNLEILKCQAGSYLLPLLPDPSYVVSTPTYIGIICRINNTAKAQTKHNNSNSNMDIDLSQDTPLINSQPERNKIMIRTQNGTQIRAHDRLARGGATSPVGQVFT